MQIKNCYFLKRYLRFFLSFNLESIRHLLLDTGYLLLDTSNLCAQIVQLQHVCFAKFSQFFSSRATIIFLYLTAFSIKMCRLAWFSKAFTFLRLSSCTPLLIMEIELFCHQTSTIVWPKICMCRIDNLVPLYFGLDNSALNKILVFCLTLVLLPHRNRPEKQTK